MRECCRRILRALRHRRWARRIISGSSVLGAGGFIHSHIFRPDFVTPANSTLTSGPNIPTLPYDARNPTGRTDMQQPPPGEGLDGLNDRLMHATNFRVLPGGVQSTVLNFTVNVSGVNPATSALYQAGVRWMELRRDPSTGVVTINQQATYAPGAINPATGRDLWMASIAQDGEGNIALAASATDSVALKPTGIYTGRLASDPPGTLPQSEVDILPPASTGVQTATQNRWGDYSSLFTDPADECTFWGAVEYADPPSGAFDWNTRVFSFKVNPACVTPARGTINGTITACASGNPLENAIITTPEGFSRQSRATGQFSMIVSPGQDCHNTSLFMLAGKRLVLALRGAPRARAAPARPRSPRSRGRSTRRTRARRGAASRRARRARRRAPAR